jgi:predicted RNA binding protein YcfA (HicA-like mRNA interferase family)
MGNFRPLPTKCWEAFLLFNGFEYSGRTKGSHDQWVKKGYRTIPVWGNKGEIPATHLKTGCFTIGSTMEALYKWAEENC